MKGGDTDSSLLLNPKQ
jgi:hypothetical protein